MYEKIIIVTRKTRLQELIERFNTEAQAHFYIEQSGGNFSEYKLEDDERYEIIEEAALIAALQSGHLGGAVLDVFEREPLDSANPLWGLPNVIVSPHVSGLRPDHWDDVIDLFGDNLERFQRGEALLNLVDVRTGY